MKNNIFLFFLCISTYIYSSESPRKVLIPQRQLRITGINKDDIASAKLLSRIQHTAFFNEMYQAFMKNGDIITCSYAYPASTVIATYGNQEDSYTISLSTDAFHIIRQLAQGVH